MQHEKLTHTQWQHGQTKISGRVNLKIFRLGVGLKGMPDIYIAFCNYKLFQFLKSGRAVAPSYPPLAMPLILKGYDTPSHTSSINGAIMFQKVERITVKEFKVNWIIPNHFFVNSFVNCQSLTIGRSYMSFSILCDN